MTKKEDFPLVSIIIRTKNEEQWLKACLTAIAKQSYCNFEIILIDNFSTDATIEVAKRQGVLDILEIAEYNPSRALNLGVEASHGDICVFLSAHCVPTDCRWLDNLIEPIISGETICSYGRQIPTTNTSPDNARDLLITFGRERVIQRFDFKFHNANSAIQKQFLVEHKFDETLSNVEDWYWAANAISLKQNIAYIPSASVFHYHGLHQHSSKSSSFRAGPVAKLIGEAYSSEGYNEPFFDYENWTGLAILSNVDGDISSLSIADIPVENVIANSKNITSSSTATYHNVTLSSEYDFHKFLNEMLNRAEQYFDKVFDYIVFADLSYRDLDIALGKVNITSLFSEWVDIACAARKITGKTIEIPRTDEIVHSSLFPKSADLAEQAELIIGQFSAIRANVIRQNMACDMRYKVTRYLTGNETFKRAL
jgi:glycosyltransferase involved in cell wall biosynthesis